jgi:hypothetical protein
MKIYYFIGKLFVCLLLAFPIFAQKPHTISLEPELISLSNRQFYIAKVIDKRLMKDNIGVVQKGLNNRQTEAIMKDGVEATFQSYFEKSLPKFSQELAPIVLIINNFRVSEKTHLMKEVGKAELSLSFCREGNTGLQKLLETNAEDTNNGMDVTGGHSKRIKAVILKCLTEFHLQFKHPITQNAENMAETKEKAEGLLIESSNNSNSLANPDISGLVIDSTTNPENHILTCAVRKVGIYKNFQELVTNSPSITTPFELTNQGSDFVMLRDIQTGKKN